MVHFGAFPARGGRIATPSPLAGEGGVPKGRRMRGGRAKRDGFDKLRFSFVMAQGAGRAIALRVTSSVVASQRHLPPQGGYGMHTSRSIQPLAMAWKYSRPRRTVIGPG